MSLNINQLKQLERRAKSGRFTSEVRQLLRTRIASHQELINLLKDPNSSLDDLYACLPSEGNNTLSADPRLRCSDSLRQGPEE